MQFCSDHWNHMREAVEARGMSHLVARSGQEAVENAISELDGTSDINNWDPLMAAHWAILSRFMGIVGLAALGDICPLCEVRKSCTSINCDKDCHVNWVEGCMDAMLHYARENKLVSDMQ